MGVDYDTVGTFYATLGERLGQFVAHHGEAAAFCGDPALQLSTKEIELVGAKPVICVKTALSALKAIIEQGEARQRHRLARTSKKFLSVREEMRALERRNPSFKPAFPAAMSLSSAPDAACGPSLDRERGRRRHEPLREHPATC